MGNSAIVEPMTFWLSLAELYGKLGATVLVGWILGQYLPRSVAHRLGVFLFWIGVPLGVMIFLRRADLSGAIWVAPVVAWAAIALGAGLAWLWSRYQPFPHTQSTGTFMLASMFGNTGYLGYPIILTLLGEEYFGWVIFYDLFGTTIGAYGFGSLFASWFNPDMPKQSPRIALVTALRNPIWWCFGLGLGLRSLTFPLPVEQGLRTVGWAVISASLVLIGMRLSQLTSWQHSRSVGVSVAIKMVLVPLGLGLGLGALGFTGALQLALVLQIAMPPAFATLVVSEAYDLDRELAVTAIALGSLSLLLTLPLWLLLFPAP
jgi:predicted permease